MFGGLERLLGAFGNSFNSELAEMRIKNIAQFINPLGNPKEVKWLSEFLIDALRYELRDPQGKKDYSKLKEVIERNKEKIRKEEIIDNFPYVVLFVGGHLENPLMYRGYPDFFRQHGIGHIYYIPLHPWQDLATNADYLIEMAEFAQKETGKEGIALIPHSRGGLVCGYAATVRPDGLSKFKTVISVGTPWHGTFVANAAYYALMGKVGEWLLEKTGYSITPIKEMMYCSRITELISEEIGKKKDIEFYSIFSLRNDEAVIPGECAIMDSSNSVNIDVDEHLGTGNIGHVGLAKSEQVRQLELDILMGKFDKEKFRKEHSIITFEEYRQRREGKGRIVTPYGKHEEIIAV